MVEGGWRDGGGMVEGWWRDGGGMVEGWWREGGGMVEGGWRDGGGRVEGGWREGGGRVEGGRRDGAKKGEWDIKREDTSNLHVHVLCWVFLHVQQANELSMQQLSLIFANLLSNHPH